MKARAAAVLVALAALLFLLSLFFPWVEPRGDELAVWAARGWDTIAAYGALPALALLLWELLRAAGVETGMRSPALLSFFFGVGAAFFGISAFIHLRWGASTFTGVESIGEFAYGAWAALWASLLVLAAAVARLAEHAHERRRS